MSRNFNKGCFAPLSPPRNHPCLYPLRTLVILVTPVTAFTVIMVGNRQSQLIHCIPTASQPIFECLRRLCDRLNCFFRVTNISLTSEQQAAVLHPFLARRSSDLCLHNVELILLYIRFFRPNFICKKAIIFRVNAAYCRDKISNMLVL